MNLEGGACITLLADKSKNINLQIFLFLSLIEIQTRPRRYRRSLFVCTTL